MSLQIFSSPFDAPQRPRIIVESQQHHDSNRWLAKDGGCVKIKSNNIMVDSRVVRLNTLISASTKNNAIGSVTADNRLMTGDIFANPIVTIPGGEGVDVKLQGGKKQAAHTPSTPPPVKGRCHISVQTEDEDNETINDDGLRSDGTDPDKVKT